MRRILHGGDGGRFAAPAPVAYGAPPAPLAAPMAARAMMKRSAGPNLAMYAAADAMHGAPAGAAPYAGFGAVHQHQMGAAGPSEADRTPGLAFCRGAGLLVIPTDDLTSDGRLAVTADDLDCLLAEALGLPAAAAGGGGGDEPQGRRRRLVERHGFTAATVAAWAPDDPSHAAVVRVAVGGVGAAVGDRAGEVVRDVGLKRPEPEAGAVCAQVGVLGA